MPRRPAAWRRLIWLSGAAALAASLAVSGCASKAKKKKNAEAARTSKHPYVAEVSKSKRGFGKPRSGSYPGRNRNGSLPETAIAGAGASGSASLRFHPRYAQSKSSYSSVNINRRCLAMTFDDGPHPKLTPRLLDILRQRKIRATFFVIGQNAKSYPGIMRRMAAEGHEVANHTWTHPYLTRMSDSAVRSQMQRTHATIVETTGKPPTLMRPPYGATNSRQKEWLLREFGYPTIMWSVDPKDWQRPGVSAVRNRLVAGARPGAILLAHDIHAPTIAAMPGTFDALLKRGYRFVTVSELIALEKHGL